MMSGSRSPSTRSPSPLIIDEQQQQQQQSQVNESNTSRCNSFSIDYILSNAVKQQQQQQLEEPTSSPLNNQMKQQQQTNQQHQAKALVEHLDLIQLTQNQQRAQLMAQLQSISANSPQQQPPLPTTTNSVNLHQLPPPLPPPQAIPFGGQMESLEVQQRLLAASQQQGEAMKAQTNNPNFFYFMACMLLQQQQQQSNLACQQAKMAAEVQRQQQQRQQQSANQASPMDSLALLARLTNSTSGGPVDSSGASGTSSPLGPQHRSLQAPNSRRQPYPLPANQLHQPPPPQPHANTQQQQHLLDQQHFQQLNQHLTRAFQGEPAATFQRNFTLGTTSHKSQKHSHLNAERHFLASSGASNRKPLFTTQNNCRPAAARLLPPPPPPPPTSFSNPNQVFNSTNSTTSLSSLQANQRSSTMALQTTGPNGEKLDNLKPAHSYIGLIGMCILSQPDKRMVLNDIYQYILDHYPYYRNRGSGWRNSVRHNLSLNECFQKAGRAANGKGHYWTIHPANMDDFMNGDFRRRRAQRKVRRWNNMDVPSDESDDESMEDATRPPLPEHFKRSIEMHKQLESRSAFALISSSASSASLASLASSTTTTTTSTSTTSTTSQQRPPSSQLSCATAAAMAAITAAAAAASAGGLNQSAGGGGDGSAKQALAMPMIFGTSGNH